MSQYDEPTQQVRRAAPPPAPLPGSLDPLRGHRGEPEPVETGTGWVDEHEGDVTPAAVGAAQLADAAEPAGAAEPPTVEADATGVLPLDEIFATPAAAEPVERVTTAAAEAPTWTAMPVVPVRSEPLTAAGPTGAWSQPASGPSAPSRAWPARASAGETLAGARERFEGWLLRDDNGLMLLTAVVACLLMIVVASVGG